MKLTIVMPVYNEERTILKILEKIEAVDLIGDMTKEIIMVDDCSQDASAKLIQEYLSSKGEVVTDVQPSTSFLLRDIKSHQPKSISNVSSDGLELKFIQHARNSGKGAALRTAFSFASGDFTIIQDADLEYDPSEYNEILRPLVEEHADVVYGSRFTGTKPRRSAGFWHYWANKFLTYMSNILNDIYVTDMETCYKAFRTGIIQGLNLKEDRFGIEPEITAKIARIPKIRLYEVAISYYGRTFEDGKKINWTDGVKAIFYILKYRFCD